MVFLVRYMLHFARSVGRLASALVFGRRGRALAVAFVAVWIVQTNLAYAVYNATANQLSVLDSVYLLEWDACADGQTSVSCTGGATAFTWQQALQRVATMNATTYKGRNDWRLPNKNELESLVDLTRSDPAIDPAFPNAPSAAFWSSTINAKNLGQAWKVNFNDGSVFVDAHGAAANIRVVRSGGANDSTDRFSLPVAPSPLDVVSANATVYDTRTLLQWDRCPWGATGAICADGTPTPQTWQQALQLPVLANAANHKGFSDWRLPNKNELESIVDLGVLPPTVEAAAFPNTPSAAFFSSTVNYKSLGQAWKVNFGDGSVFVDAHVTVANVRLVRGGGPSGGTDRFSLPVTPSPLDVVAANATVYDTRTLLQWDRCPSGVTGASCAGGMPETQTWQQALQLPVLANTANHKGFSDWRLPNKNELESIVDLGVLPPTLEAGAFPNTPSTAFFSSTVNYKNLGQAWKVNFGDGSVFVDAHGTAANVRLVRGGGTSGSADRLNLPMPPSPYSAASGTVTDARTGLIWDNCSFGKTGTACTGASFQVSNWQDALLTSNAANNTSYKGFNDWRVPNKNELESLVDLGRLAPAIDASVFPDTQSHPYWSSTVNAKSAGQAWTVNFGDGSVSVQAQGTAAYFRLVRGGSAEDGLDVTAPMLTAVSGTVSTLTATSNEAATGYWIVVPRGATAPTAAQVRARANYGSVTLAANGTGSMAAGVAANFGMSGLSAVAQYDAYIVAVDAVGNVSLAALAQFGTLPINGTCGTANGVAVTTAPTTNLCAAGTASPATPTGPGPWTWSCVGANTGTTAPCSAPLRDTTPPSLTNVAATTTTVTATSNEAGTGYWIALARSAAAPTVVQVRTYALLGAAGVLARGTGAMAANVATVFAVPGLTATVLYDFYVVAEDGAGNLSGLVKSQNTVDPACAASSVANIEMVDLSQSMTQQAVQLLTTASIRTTFNVTCANGRFGVVRLPKVVGASLGGQAYALVQSSCATKPVQQAATLGLTTPASVLAAVNKRGNSATLISDPLVGPLANWVCQ